MFVFICFNLFYRDVLFLNCFRFEFLNIVLISQNKSDSEEENLAQIKILFQEQNIKVLTFVCCSSNQILVLAKHW